MNDQKTQSKLQDLIDEAQHQLSTYRNPNVDEVSEQLSEILKILGDGKGTLEHDRIESIQEKHGNLVINTSYSLRGCVNSEEYEIPMEIIRADDPCAAAANWVKKQALNESEADLKRLQSELENLPAYAVHLKAQIEIMQAQVNQQREEILNSATVAA